MRMATIAAFCTLLISILFVIVAPARAGAIWRSTGAPCAGQSCPGWTMLDNNGASKSIVASGGALYQLHGDGRIWRYTNVPCNNAGCPGWQLLDNNSRTKQLAVGASLFQIHGN